MRAGPLRHRLMLQSLVTGQDAIGQPIQTWEDAGIVRGDLRFLSGLETVKSDAAVAVTRGSLRVRYRDGIVPNMRLIADDKVYDIKAVLPDTTGRRHLDLVVETGQNLG